MNGKIKKNNNKKNIQLIDKTNIKINKKQPTLTDPYKNRQFII